MIKVLLIMPLTTLQWGSKNAGGVDSVCQMLVEQMTKSASKDFYYRVLAFEPHNKVKYTGEVIKLAPNLEVIRSPVKEGFFALPVSGLISCNYRVAQQVKLFKPTLIHSHISTWLLGAYNVKKRVATVHSFKNIGRKPVSFLNDFLYVTLLPNLIDKFVNYYTVVGENLAKALQQDTKKSISIIANPISNIFSPSNYSSKKEKLQLVTCSLITRKKQVHIAVKLLSDLRESGLNAALNVIGPNSDNVYYNELKTQIANLKLNEHVQFLGRCSQQEVARYYQEADLGVFFSAEETFGLAPLEMIASGLPLLSTKVGILAEQEANFKKFESIMLIDVKQAINSRAVVDGLDGLLNSDTQLAQRFIHENFTAQGVLEKYEALYREVST